MTRHDVVVLGGGPAALAVAAASVQAGLSVARVDPSSPSDADEGVWPNTYGVWIDELVGLDLDDTLAHRYDDVTVVGNRSATLPRSYGVFDNAALMIALSQRAANVEVVRGRAVGANHDRWRSTALLQDGRFLDAAVLVDATGHWPVVVHRAERPAVATQAAYGVVARVARRPFEAGCILMDWSWGDAADPDPTFLYALELRDGWWLLEETSLARRSPMGLAELRSRLHRRLDDKGVALSEVRAVEEVDIPLGLPVPSRRQRAVGSGGSASLVHPATGYSVGASLRAAPQLAGAIAQALQRGATPEGISAAAWAAVWPAGRRRARALEEYGLGALLRLDLGEVREFFDAFFALAGDQWFRYVTGSLGPRDVAVMMRQLFAEVPGSVKAKLMAANPLPLLRAVG